MRRVLKVLGLLVVVIAVVAGAAATFFAVRGIPRYTPTDRPTITVEVTPERVARGKRWVSMLCADCHRNPVSRLLTGRDFTDLPPEFGAAYIPNITQDKVHGIGAWSDAELVYLLRTGVKRDGGYAPPWMAKLPNISDEDLLSIVAFLRSDDPWVKAQPVKNRPSRPSFLAKALCNTVFKPLPYPKAPIVAPAPDKKVELGRYLGASLDCYACHSADFKTNDLFQIEKSAGFLGGGNMILDANARPAYSTNITPDAATGIGKWSEADFVRAVKDGFRPDQSPIRAPMPRYPELGDDEVRAIYAYERTVPALVKQNRPWAGDALGASATDGERLYHKYACTSCHGDRGLGSCDLRGANRKYKDDAELVAWIRDPSKILPDTKMPTWDGLIPEADYAPLVAWVRHLGAVAPAP